MHLTEGLKEERRCLRLRLNGGRYAFDEEGEKPRILVPVQLQGARDDLGMHYSMRRFAHLFSVRELVAGHVLDDFAAGLCHRPVREHYCDPDDEVPYGPVA